MNQDLILFLLFASAGLIQYGCLLLNIDTKNKRWKWAINGGMIASGIAAIGIYIPKYIPVPCIIFSTGVVWMLINVFLSYYNAQLPETSTSEQLEDQKELKHSTVKQLAFGLIMLLVVSVIVAFTQGQQDSTRVQVSFTGAMERIADEISMLNNKITQLSGRVGKLEEKADASAKGDSVARNVSFRNQEILLKRKR